MIDPKEILEATKSIMQLGQSSTASMSAPFLSAVPGMNPAGAGNASSVIDGIQGVGAQMLSHMTNIKSSIDQQLFAHQDAQRRQRTYDFKPDMSDLRPSDAKGFPREMGDEFFAPFKK